jgi:hypothetical protein
MYCHYLATFLKIWQFFSIFFASEENMRRKIRNFSNFYFLPVRGILAEGEESGAVFTIHFLRNILIRQIS